MTNYKRTIEINAGRGYRRYFAESAKVEENIYGPRGHYVVVAMETSCMSCIMSYHSNRQDAIAARDEINAM